VLLEVNDLKTYFQTDDGIVKAVDGRQPSASRKARHSGSSVSPAPAKSVTCLTIMGLNAKKNTITSGEALFNGGEPAHCRLAPSCARSAATTSR